MAIGLAPSPALDYALIFNASKNFMAIADRDTGVMIDVSEQWMSAIHINNNAKVKLV